MRFSKSARAVALATCAAGGMIATAANAAVTITDVFSGNWPDSARPNKGWDIDVLTRSNGDKVLFLYSATFDAEGRPYWITTNFDFKEFEFEFTGKPLVTFEGSTFSGSEDPTRVDIGTVDVSIESCGEINISVHPNAASGFQPFSQRLIPAQAYASGVEQKGSKCVYKKKFTGCPAGTTAGVQPRSCVLRGAITSDRTLTNDTTWVLDGLVRVGGETPTRPY